MTLRPPTRRQRRAGADLFAGLIGASIALLFCDTWLLKGALFPLVVEGGSMAPTLLGAHRHWDCEHCGFGFDESFDESDAASNAANFSGHCPRCTATNDIESADVRAGSRLWIDRNAFSWRSPRRYETVVCRVPDDPSQFCVKRIIGLPGERVRLVAGQIWINGQIARKTPDEERAVRLPVPTQPIADTKSSGLSPRWVANPPERWRAGNGDTYLHEGTSRPDSADSARSISVDWLELHGAILDDSLYNASESRVLAPVEDIALSFHLPSASGTYWLRAESRGEHFLARLDLDRRQASLEHNGQVVDGQQLPAAASKLRWSICDRQIRLSIDDADVFELPFAPCESGDTQCIEEPPSSLAIGVPAEAAVRLEQLRLWRDVVYEWPTIPSIEPDIELQADEYFVLGDNAPHSRDSRHWPGSGAVTARQIVGRVFRQ